MNNRQRRHFVIRKKISGTKECPRLAVFKSGKYIYAQIIDDVKMHTLAAATDFKQNYKGTKVEKAFLVGQEIAKKAVKTGIKKVAFDRGGFLYHGRIQKVAEGAREGGLKF